MKHFSYLFLSLLLAFPPPIAHAFPFSFWATGGVAAKSLVVGAAGSGGEYRGGGAGGGDVESNIDTLLIGSYAVTVGGTTARGSNPGAGNTGADSSFNGHTGKGGGAGGGGTAGSPTSGGSGGGGGTYGDTNQAGAAAGTGSNVFAGGNGSQNASTIHDGGGGGGAGAAGSNATLLAGGAGGTGFASAISGTSTIYGCGGGGGGDPVNPGAAGCANAGTGGDGAGSGNGGNGAANKGGGGGGAAGGGAGGTGGSGVVIITAKAGLITATGGTQTYNTNSTGTCGFYECDVWTFTSSGTFQITAINSLVDTHNLALLHFDGNVTDFAPTPSTWGLFGSTVTSATQAKFGSQSLDSSASANGARTASAANNILGSGDFTIDFWLYTGGSVRSSTQGLAGNDAGGLASQWSLLTLSTGLMKWQEQGGATSITSSNWATGTSNNSWVHVAVVRCSGTLTFYFNGTAGGTGSTSANLNSTADNLFVGYAPANSIQLAGGGFIDEFRMSNVCRWTTNFTPPTVAY